MKGAHIELGPQKTLGCGSAALRYLGNFSMPDRLHDFIQGDLFFNHLLLRVLRYPEGSGRRSGLDASEQGFEFDSVGLPHSISRLARPTGCRQDRTRKGSQEIAGCKENLS
jgi:hypothetical protein